MQGGFGDNVRTKHMNNDELMQIGSSLTINYKFLDKLQTYEDYLSFYIQLEETHKTFAWLKADTLLHMTIKLGQDSPTQLAKDLKLPPSTATNYIRVARAFPPDTREELTTFSGHLEASFADSYDDKTGTFEGNKRFEWIKKAAEENMPTRLLKREISESKEENSLKHAVELTVNEIFKYIGALKERAIRGDVEARARIEEIHGELYGRQ